MLNVTGLWLNESKDGKRKYMAGNLGGLKVLIFKNEHKRGERDPDYTLCLAERERKNGNGAGSGKGNEPQEDIPF